ncbi:hypothetical protein CROQUDRAFT_372465 [Cronartium quercuum f. sp. fusiforme G11]|uniref:Uncharacterized protein n=1 Tax=Cronartium quercuum f. sp. fusiforme G11 TaxID=708437 RepID=A0A9P6NN31_9BASI|nr:hypothetical protein CROQUDRAFT_372465 [Cronartium quercuum f. sp. fusiforme G11]
MVLKRTINRGQKSKRTKPSDFTVPDIPEEEATALFQRLGFFGSRPHPSQPAMHEQQLEEADGLDDDAYLEGVHHQPANDSLEDDSLDLTSDTPIDLLVRTLKAKEYARKRLEFGKQWATLEAILTAIVLERQHFTGNWTTTSSYLTDQLSF